VVRSVPILEWSDDFRAHRALAGPDVRADSVTFRVADPDCRLAGVRLVQDVPVRGSTRT